MSVGFPWIYITLFVSFQMSASLTSINKAPAKVTLRMQISKLNQKVLNLSRLNLCVDKLNERCFWTLNEDLQLDGEQYKEISYGFVMDNMATDLTIEVTIEHGSKKIEFHRKTINLVNLGSKKSFEMHSFSLESFITLTIEDECENGYYPPKQCTKFCYPMPNESDCDGFGNRICKEGLLYDAQLDRCIANNCIKSNIRCNNGQCINKAQTFECVCLESYYGKFCEMRNPCYPNPCSNGGQCTPDVDVKSYTCVCPAPFTDPVCQTKVKEKCKCPKEMKCHRSKTGESCISETVETSKDIIYISPSDSKVKEETKSGGLESKRNQEWSQVSMTTTIIAAIGCLMLILCIGVSLYIFYQMQVHKSITRNKNIDNSPSTLYTEFPPRFTETSFKRSLSLDDNSAYVPADSQLFQILPNSIRMGSSNEYSIHRNTYMDNPPSSLRNYPPHEGFIFQREYPLTPLLLHQNYMKASSLSSTSGSSLPTPPVLPPRSNTLDVTSSGTLPKHE